MTHLFAANPHFQDNLKQKVWVELAQTPHSHVEMQSRCARATAESEVMLCLCECPRRLQCGLPVVSPGIEWLHKVCGLIERLPTIACNCTAQQPSATVLQKCAVAVDTCRALTSMLMSCTKAAKLHCAE